MKFPFWINLTTLDNPNYAEPKILVSVSISFGCIYACQKSK